MSVTRDFDAMVAETAGVKPTFTVAGQIFTLRAKLPWAKWQQLLAVMRSEDAENVAATAEFFDTVLIKSDRQRFKDLMTDNGDDTDDELVIGLQQMDAITEWAMEHFTGKLPSSSGGSTPGVNGTGPQPNVISLSSKAPANAG